MVQRLGHLAVFGLLLVCVVRTISPSGAVGQDTIRQDAVRTDSVRVYSFVFLGVPMQQTLEILISNSDIPLFFESRLVASKTSNCQIHDADLSSVLKCVLKGSGLDYLRMSNGTYVVTEQGLQPAAFGSVSGIIIDAASNLPIQDAAVLLPDQGIGTATNRSGWFQLPRLLPGPHAIIVTHVAYQDVRVEVEIEPWKASSVRIPILLELVLSPPIVVYGLTMRQPSSLLGVALRTTEQLTRRPGGIYAVVNNLQSLPGLSSSPALGDLHVQGSASGSHEYLLDEATIYMPIKNGAFIGPFSPLAIGHLTVQKAGFPARTGSQLAGFVEISQRVSDAVTPAVTLQVDPLAFNGRIARSFELNSGRSLALMMSGRKSFGASLRPKNLVNQFEQWSRPDVFLADQLDIRNESVENVFRPVEVDFTDFHSSVTLDLGRTRTLSASTYYGFNVFGSDLFEEFGDAQSRLTDEYQWTNRMTQVRYEWVPGSSAFFHVGLWKSDYRLKHPFSTNPLDLSEGPQKTSDFNEIDQLGGRFRSDFSVGSRSFVSAGISARITDSDFTVSTRPALSVPDLTSTTAQPSRWLLGGFLEDVLSFSELASLTFGSRFSFIPSHGRVYLEPRISWRQDVQTARGMPWAYRFSGGIYRQYTSQFDLAPYSETALLPSFRLWIPIGKKERPSYAYHLTGDVLVQPRSHLSLSLETFFKFSPRILVLDYSLIAEGPITKARSRIGGGALSATWNGRLLQIEGTYSFELSQIQQPSRFEGVWVSAPWESPHRLHFSIDASVLRNLRANVQSTAVLGRAWGYRLSYYNYLPLTTGSEDIVDLNLSHPESHSLPAFVQLDAGLTYDLEMDPVFLQVNFSVLNVLDRSNVVDWMIEDLSSGNGGGGAGDSRFRRTALPRLFLLSLQLSF